MSVFPSKAGHGLGKSPKIILIISGNFFTEQRLPCCITGVKDSSG